MYIFLENKIKKHYRYMFLSAFQENLNVIQSDTFNNIPYI